MSATALQPEPSAKAPCTRTTFLICSFMIILLYPLVSFRSSHQTCRCCPENPTPTHNAVRLAPLTTRSILLLICRSFHVPYSHPRLMPEKHALCRWQSFEN